MKTILYIAQECGATDCKDIADDGSLMLNEAQLTATIDLCNRQSEPIYQIDMGMSNCWTDSLKESYDNTKQKYSRIVYLAPQQPPAKIAQMQKQHDDDCELVRIAALECANMQARIDELENALRYYLDNNGGIVVAREALAKVKDVK